MGLVTINYSIASQTAIFNRLQYQHQSQEHDQNCHTSSSLSIICIIASYRVKLTLAYIIDLTLMLASMIFPI